MTLFFAITIIMIMYVDTGKYVVEYSLIYGYMSYPFNQHTSYHLPYLLDVFPLFFFLLESVIITK